MTRNEALKEMLGNIEDFEQCTIYLDNEDIICIEPAENFVGGEEGYLMCSHLGNIMYSSPESICVDVLNFIGDTKLISEITVD